MRDCVDRLGRIVTVEPVIFLFMTSTFIVTPAYQQLIISKVCYELFQDKSACGDPERRDGEEEVQRRSSYILLLYMAILSLVSVPPALLLGSWSDRAGRRAVMLLPSLLSLAAGAVLLAVDLVDWVSVYWCLAAAAAVGLTGGHVSMFLSCFSYLADVTAGCATQRTLRMAVAESMIFVGGTLGFLLGGFLEQKFSLMPAFAAYMTCHALTVLYILVWLRDPQPSRSNAAPPMKEVTAECEEGGGEEEVGSVPRERSRLFILTYGRRTFHTVFCRRPGQERLKLHLLITCSFLNNLVAIGEQSILLLYLMYEPREFSTEMFGLFNSVKMLLLGLFLLGVFPLLLKCVREMPLAKISVLFRMASYVLLALANNTWMVFLVAAVGAPAGINQAVIRSLSSAIVEPDEQGAMFSFSASVEATCLLFAAVIFNGLYPQTLPTFPGMPFIVMAAFCLVVLILLQWISEMQATQPRLILQD
ncbi:proton-coupled folate transporter isoform X3 [Denticeps clupeoides]|uniref:Proton-coupled folate transporter-like n=3 Tax=Denticeps clupeoides TaxID=299321 RepID=A0AAY4B2E2_9TELE|nr:proton-coupled folate transporter-like isoform X3 [Denticeps clupeoides]XP_028855435.1 proton-coupled folate transporter-like isoform X3 [Denticeps clupeoides]